MNNAPIEGIRLNKFIASSGLASRRAADTLIFEGHVTINDEPCTNPGQKVSYKDHVRVDGKSIRSKNREAIIFYKLPGYVTTKNDELGRETIYDILPPKYKHLNHVGRLDQDSEGLLVLTNDGDLANKLTHPKQKIEKEYIVTANQPFEESHLEQFLKGIYLEEGKATAKAVTRLSGRRISMVLETGMKRQIRMMCRALGYKVKKLVRVRIGAYQGLDLEFGEARVLEEGEINALLRNPTVKKAPSKKAVVPKKKYYMPKGKHGEARPSKSGSRANGAKRTNRPNNGSRGKRK